MEEMARTNVVVDERLLERVMELYGLRTKREAIDFALRRTLAATDDPHERALALEGSGWDADLDELRDEPISTL
jgi:Arc/MetJ family transcription regulator